jgi:hypothetical protein
MSRPYIPYSDSVETLRSGEEQDFDDVAATLLDISKKVGERQRHAVRSVHAKSHGLLRAEVVIPDGLPEELRQGLFAKPASYPAVMRVSTIPGEILSDHISTPRGMAVKIIGVDGEMAPAHAGEVTQDLVMVNSKVFASPDAKGFLAGLKTLDQHVNDSEALKQTVSSVAQVAQAALETVGATAAALKRFGHPATHPLGEAYYTVGALRYGKYFGKIGLFPVSATLRALASKHLADASDWNALKDAIVEFFKSETAVWELRVQLCTDSGKMPVEDPTVEWDETLSPYIAVAQVAALPQAAYSDARRVWFDEELAFSPWHCLEAHRPLGSIMRARLKAYRASSVFRHAAEGRKLVEPRSIDEMPA